MSTGKHLNLEAARKRGLHKQFAREHDVKGEKGAFERLLKAMASGKKPEAAESSDQNTSED